MSDDTDQSKREAPWTPGEFAYLLSEIEKEQVPEKLLDFARQLQQILGERRRDSDKETDRSQTSG